MKKVLVILLVIGCMIMVPYSANAQSKEVLSGESVYASKTEQNEIYDIIQKSELFMNSMREHGVSIDKESITPVYVADILDYAETSNFEIIPYVTGHFKEVPTNDGGQVYTAKTVTPGGVFGGYYYFYVEDGIAYHTNFTPSSAVEPSNTSVISLSYADHAERIARLSNKKTFVPASEVRFVLVNGLGTVFYINDGETEKLTVVSGDERVFNDIEVVAIGGGLKEKADVILREHKEQLAEVEEWKTTHPGEEYSATGSLKPYYTVSSNDVNDVANISVYLASDGSSDSPLDPNDDDETPSGSGLGIVLGIIAVAAVSVTTIGVIIFKRK